MPLSTFEDPPMALPWPNSFMSRWFGRRRTPIRGRKETIARSKQARPRLEVLEDRLAPATFSDNGTTLTLLLNTANANVTVVSASTAYTLTLTGDTWSGT